MPSRVLAPNLLADIPLIRAAQLGAAPARGTWHYQDLVGVLAEISEERAAGAVSFAVEIMGQAQAAREHAAWVAAAGSLFFPPDLAARGIDLSALTVIRAGGCPESFLAAEWLARSGAVGLVIVDLNENPVVSDSALGRIQKIAERSPAAVVFLTRKKARDPSLGSRISVRGNVSRQGTAPLAVTITTVRDKRAGAGSRLGRHYDGPPGVH
jgi:recombination protein RecA